MEELSMKILIIDDDEVDRMAITRALRKTSFQVETEEADRGEEALRILNQSRFDCIMLDYNLPGMNGMEILKSIRESGHLQPVIILTGHGGEQLAVEIMKSGATDYIVKERIKPAFLEKSLKYARRVFQAEEEVRRYQANLEDLVEARTSELKKAQDRLLEASHRAGMAEVATDVLHGVGNVLNSVKVAASVIQSTMDQSKVDGLSKVVELMIRHEDDLGQFFTVDNRGAMVPSYLLEITKALRNERESILEQIDELSDKIYFIENIVTSQQNYAKWVKGVVETCNLSNLIEDAVKINSGNLLKFKINVERDFEEMDPVTLETHKLEQILVNLISNAVYALELAPVERKVIHLTSRRLENSIQVSVADNGTGIDPENLTKIFHHGFTTRKDGHGFGLHSCANLAKELGGSLTAHSDGPAKGARFTLEMPLIKKDDQHA